MLWKITSRSMYTVAQSVARRSTAPAIFLTVGWIIAQVLPTRKKAEFVLVI